MAKVRRDVGALTSYFKAVALIALGAAIGGTIIGVWQPGYRLRPHESHWMTCDELKWTDEHSATRLPRASWMNQCGYIPEGVVTSD